MQSDSNRNSYLSQYKDDISSKQKSIRQRLYGTTDEDNFPTSSRHNLDQDNIPSIDDEFVEQVSQERRYKSRFSYFDDEAEASLQFFKKNLQPLKKSGLETGLPTTTTTTGSSSLFDKSPLLNYTSRNLIGQSNRGPNSDSITANERFESRREKPTQITETKLISNQYQTNSPRLVPFKQTSLGSAEQPKPIERSTAKSFTSNAFRSQPATETRYEQPRINERIRRDPILSNLTQPKRLSDRNGIGTTDLDDIDDILRATTEKTLITNRQARERDSAARENVAREDHSNMTRGQSPEGYRLDSPSQSTTFSRKPLYNSLLRAHDSIRLKVNRPKVRPKSQGQVPDTEIDDSIQLADMNGSVKASNERAVDVKRSSSRRKSKKKNKEQDEPEDKLPVRNFSEVRIVKVVRNEDDKSLGVTVKVENGNIVVARIMAGSLADKQGVLQVGDIILAVNNREVYTPEQLQEELRRNSQNDTDFLKIVPSFREELPTLCLYLRALFSYDANEDSLLPCKEIGVSFNQGDILEVVNQEDPNWWQARRVDSENLQTGLIPSQELEERRRAFVIPDYDLATRTSICGTRVSRKSKKKEIYNIGQNGDFDKAELQLYEEVCRTPAFERRTLVLIGANGVGKQALKARLINMDPERFGTPLPHTSRLPREGEEDGIHYHFVTREKMEEDIIEGKYLEFGEYDGALYGTKLDSVREIIGSGKVCVLDCSPTCLKVLKTSDYLPFVAFIAAPTLDQLRYMHEWARSGGRNYATFDRALSRQSRRARTLQDFAFDFFEDEDLQLTIEESARLFRIYENYFDIVLVNNNFEATFGQLKEAVDALSMAPQWIPISWIYGT